MEIAPEPANGSTSRAVRFGKKDRIAFASMRLLP